MKVVALVKMRLLAVLAVPLYHCLIKFCLSLKFAFVANELT